MKCTTLLSEFDFQEFLGEENGELLDAIYELESCGEPYVKSTREVQYEIIIEAFDINKGLRCKYYETLPEAMEAFNEKVKTLEWDENIYLCDIESRLLIADVQNFDKDFYN